MKHGDISGTYCKTILLRVEGTLFTLNEPTSLKDKLKRMIGILDYEIDYNVVNFLVQTNLKTDYKVELVVDPLNAKIFLPMINELQLPFSRVVQYSQSTINLLVEGGAYIGYVDNDIPTDTTLKHCYNVATIRNVLNYIR